MALRISSEGTVDAPAAAVLWGLGAPFPKFTHAWAGTACSRLSRLILALPWGSKTSRFPASARASWATRLGNMLFLRDLPVITRQPVVPSIFPHYAVATTFSDLGTYVQIGHISGRPPPSLSRASPDTHRSLAVVPLISDQRYYGEATVCIGCVSGVCPLSRGAPSHVAAARRPKSPTYNREHSNTMGNTVRSGSPRPGTAVAAWP